MSGWIDGLALAAMVAGDRSGEAARRGLGPEDGEALAARLAALRGPGMERALSALAASLRPSLAVPEPSEDTAHPLPPRAAAIVAPQMPRALGARWIARAPLPRVGFRVAPSLRAQVERLVREALARNDAVDARDRGAGRRVLAQALADDGFPSAQALGVLEPEEAGAVMTLASLQGPGGDAARAAAQVRLALAAGAGPALTVALGAMERGSAERAAPAQVGMGPWARAGREIAELEERGCRG